MNDRIKGTIVSSQTSVIAGTEKEYGYIVVEDSESCDHIQLKVDANTEIQTLERNDPVAIKTAALGSTDILRAVEVCKD
ncbi:MAG: hypothetical protein ACFFF4_03925 [Candidatus Thorarchaeota archaeon]